MKNKGGVFGEHGVYKYVTTFLHFYLYVSLWQCFTADFFN